MRDGSTLKAVLGGSANTAGLLLSAKYSSNAFTSSLNLHADIATQVQPQERAGSLVAGRLSAVLGVRESRLGWEVPGPVVYALDAKPARTDEESRQDAAQPPRAMAQLVLGQRRAFLRRGGGIQQQSETDHEKIVRLSHLQSR